MARGILSKVAANEKHPLWEELVRREKKLYLRDGDVRSPFARDYTRILHSLAYRRLKHKTQVFFNIENDHICTRMEHVSHVESVSSTIAGYLGLNQELTKAISIGHDLGHTPFGHQGETVVKELIKENLGEGECFWHEKNGIHFVDHIELLEDTYGIYQNLNLTYAVRDGIICHCGEKMSNGLIPRKYTGDLYEFNEPGAQQAATWEGCVVRMADRIAYIGRDIEDAKCLGFLNAEVCEKLQEMARERDQKAINTTTIMYNMIADLCENSSIERGICLSNRLWEQMDELSRFNSDYIYNHERLQAFKDYTEVIIRQIFNILNKCYEGKHTFDYVIEKKKYYPTLSLSFSKWLARYCNVSIVPDGELKDLALKCKNKKIYNELETKDIYIKAILDYISGMTDRFAIKIFNEFLTY